LQHVIWGVLLKVRGKAHLAQVGHDKERRLSGMRIPTATIIIHILILVITLVATIFIIVNPFHEMVLGIDSRFIGFIVLITLSYINIIIIRRRLN